VKFHTLAISLILLFLCQLQVNAQCTDLEKSIEIRCNWCSIEQFIAKIENESDLSFNYSTEDFRSERFEFINQTISISELLNREIGLRGFAFDCVGDKSIVIYASARQSIGMLSGFIVDKESLQPLEDVFVRSNRGKWTFSNQDGYYRFEQIRFPDTISFQRIGFSEIIMECKSQNDLSLVMMSSDEKLEEVRVYGRDSVLLDIRRGGWFINLQNINEYPSLKASPGVINKLSLLPGIQSTVEVNGGIVVRGGGKNQNQVLLDGVELYNPTHMFGMFGTFTDQSLQGVEMYKGSFPGKFNGRLSSVLNMRSKSGNFNKWNGAAYVNPLFAGVYINGPLIKEKTSMSLSARRSFTDFFPIFYEQVQQQNSVDRFRFYFYDIKGSITHRFSASNSVYIHSYFGGDVGYINQRESFTSGQRKNEESKDQFLQSNFLLSAGWKNWWNKNLGSKLSVGLTRYTFDYSNSYDLSLEDDTSSYQRKTNLDYLNRIEDKSINLDMFGYFGEHLNWGVGGQFINHSFIPNSSNYFLQENDLILIDTSFNNRKSLLNEFRMYSQVNWSLGRFKFHTGLSLVNFGSDSSYWQLQPRLHIESKLNKRSLLHMGFARTAQFVHAVPNNSLGIPLDVWMPSNADIVPMTSEQFEIGWKGYTKSGYSLQLDLYQRTLSNVLSYQYSVYDLVSDWQDAVSAGQGRAFGLELMLHKRKGKLNGWIKYSLSKSERLFENINEGQWFPFKYDRRHDFALVLQYRINKKWNIGMNTVFASGHYITIPEAQYVLEINGNSTLVSNFGDLNNLKVPDYFRTDFGINYDIKRKKSEQSLSLKIYNLFNRQNVYYVTSKINENGSSSLVPIALFPFLPTINYAINF